MDVILGRGCCHDDLFLLAGLKKKNYFNAQHCSVQIEYRVHVFMSTEEGLLYRARYFGDSDLYQRAQRMGTPSCSRLAEVQTSVH